MDTSAVRDSLAELNSAVGGNTFLVFIIAIVVAFLINRLLAKIIVSIARKVSHFSDTAKTSERNLQFRRIETYLSVALALLRIFIFGIAILTAWRLTHNTAGSVAVIGASTVFVVLAGATIVPLLRDFTTGSIMIAEQWYSVGDHVSLDPFGSLSGIVERMTLRSTRIRSLSGEVIWVHNQYIQAVRTTPGGTKTLAMDIFVTDEEKGKELVKHTAQTIPVNPTMLATPLHLVRSQKLNDKLWQLTAVAQTAPGREWLLEDFAPKVMQEKDEEAKKSIILHGPLVHYADPDAERRFKRAMRFMEKQEKPSK